MNKAEEIEKIVQDVQEYAQKATEKIKEIESQQDGWKVGDEYFYIDDRAYIRSSIYDNDYLDLRRIKIGNAFRTRKDAANEVKHREAVAKWQRLSEPYKVDKFSGHNKYSLLFNVSRNEFYTDYGLDIDWPYNYVDTKKHTEQIIKQFTEPELFDLFRMWR